MKRIVVYCFLVVMITACHKDKVETIPHLSFKSFNTDILGPGNTLRVTLEFTDKEGDLQSLYVIRERLNSRGPSHTVLPYDIPAFNGQQKGELFATLDYATDITLNLGALRIPGSNPAQNEPDTLQLKFYVQDKAGNVSDSTPPKQIIVIR